VFAVVLMLLKSSLFAQTGNFGVGYGAGWYYNGIKNVKASMVAFNADKEYLSETAFAKEINHGFSVTMKGNKLGMIFPFSLMKNKVEFSGTNPGNGSNEVYTISNIHIMWGAGWRIDKERTCIALVFNQGFASYRYSAIGTGTNEGEWQSLPGWPQGGQGCLMYGSTIFYEYFPRPRIGMRFSWYAHWVAMDSWFTRSEMRHKFSQVQATLTLYIRKQYDR
jgi:hypothetical protein